VRGSGRQSAGGAGNETGGEGTRGEGRGGATMCVCIIGGSAALSGAGLFQTHRFGKLGGLP